MCAESDFRFSSPLQYVVRDLLASDAYSKVLVIGRRSGVPNYYPESTKLVEIVGSLDGMCELTSAASVALELHRPQVAFCCLGTTMAIAGSKAAFKLVDYTYATDFAFLVRRWRVPSFNLVSAWGASASSAALYTRTKGKVEKYIKALNFPYTTIYRPGLLLRDEPTPEERCFGHIMKPLPADLFAAVIANVPIDIFETHGVTEVDIDTMDGLFQGPQQLLKTWDNDHIYKFFKTKKLKASIEQQTDR